MKVDAHMNAVGVNVNEVGVEMRVCCYCYCGTFSNRRALFGLLM